LNAKFLGTNGGTLANAIKAVNYFTDLKTRHGINLVATNNSWGGGGYSKGLFDAIESAKPQIFYLSRQPVIAAAIMTPYPLILQLQ